jgi:hypothetical protein
MMLRFSADFDVDPAEISSLPEKVVRDEIASALESVDYVLGCFVRPLTLRRRSLRLWKPA